jgi:hypothetical protein
MVIPQCAPGYGLTMAAHHAAFDESGKADREHVVFAGLISYPGRWSQMIDKWMSLLEPHGLRYWRSTNAAQLNEQFTRFRQRRKDLEKLTLDLVQLICEYAEGGSVNSVTMELYNKLGPDRRQEWKDPFYAAFQHGMLALVGAAHVGAVDTVTLVCDDSEEYSSECLKMYRRLKKLNPGVTGRLVSVCFHDDSVYPPLQAADLFAFCYRKKAEGTLSGIWLESLELLNDTFSVREPGDLIG